ncbi:ABC transporter permease [Streptomyces formicae]|uniref:Putative ABC transporter integral membrane protein n=1 Tax=Streptomyces formicae TaxID=1616117 RepID=A0A291QA36_9ACTN|nr:ABC transporter permease [Streptomyces formicae]ATL28304.1 putative ABC transporter integral membrane protein [Streptomyces formicae]
MFRTALRNVLAHKARLLMTVLAVMLGVAFVSGTLVFTDTFGNAYKNKSAKSFDHVSVAIQPDGVPLDSEKQPGRLTDGLLRKAGSLPGADSAIGTVSGFTALADKDGKLVGGEWGTTGTNFFPAKDGKDPRYDFTEGTGPKSAADIALDSRTAERTGYKVGDTVRFSTDGPVHTAKVSGIFDTDDGSVVAGGSLVVLDNKTALKALGKHEYDEIDVKAAAGTSEAALKSSVEKILPKETDAVTGAQLSSDQDEQIEQQTSSMSQVLLIFAGIALFVGIFIIANTFTMLVAQRTKELALMRAVGASRRQVTRSVLIEAFLVGLVAAVTGFALGLGVAVGLQALMNAGGASLPDGPLIIAPTTIVAALVIGVLVTMLAAWLPGRRAAKIPPVAAMNSVHATPTTRGLVVRNTIGSIIVALGAVLLFNDDNYVMAGGAATIMVGVIILTPLLSRPFIAASAPLLKPFGVTGKLSRLNSVRNPRRTASTAAALMIGLTLITAMTVVATSMGSAINKMAAGSLKADYSVSMANYEPLAPEVRQKIDKIPDVEATSPLRTAYGEADGSYTNVNGVDSTTFGKLVGLDLTSGSVDALKGDTALIDTDTAKDKGLTTGDTFPLKFQDDKKTVELKVAGVYENNEMLNGLFTPTSVVDPHVTKVADKQVLVKMKDGASDKAEDSIVKALGENPAITIQDKDAISNAVAGGINMVLNILYGLLAMAILIAVLGVINTLAMSVFERKHEIGMLRAIGLDRAKVKQMVRLESIVISLFGAVLGIGLGLFMGWAVGSSVADAVSTYSMEIPVGRIVIFLAVAALVGVLAAVWPARSAARLNPLQAIKAE